MTTPATIQVQQGETMTNSIPSNQPTGDQRAEIAEPSMALRVTANASELPPDQRYCHCCEQRIARRFAWLELDQRINAYHDLGGVPPEHSQGWFPFGLTCARKLKRAAIAKSEGRS